MCLKSEADFVYYYFFFFLRFFIFFFFFLLFHLCTGLSPYTDVEYTMNCCQIFHIFKCRPGALQIEIDGSSTMASPGDMFMVPSDTVRIPKFFFPLFFFEKIYFRR